MAWNINKVVLVGRLTSDIDLRSTQTGDLVARFGIAVNGRPSKDGQDVVSFFTVVVWNKSAEMAQKFLKKGDKIAIDGRLEQRTWKDKNNNNKSVVEIIAERIEFLQNKS